MDKKLKFTRIPDIDPKRDVYQKMKGTNWEKINNSEFQLDARISILEQEEKYGLLPQMELEIQWGGILKSIDFIESKLTESGGGIPFEKSKEKKQRIKAFIEPIDPDLNYNETNEKYALPRTMEIRKELILKSEEILEALKSEYKRHKVNLTDIKVESVETDKYLKEYDKLILETGSIIENQKNHQPSLSKISQEFNRPVFDPNIISAYIDIWDKLLESIRDLEVEQVLRALDELTESEGEEMDTSLQVKLIPFISRINRLRTDYGNYIVDLYSVKLELLRIFGEIISTYERLFPFKKE